MQTSGLLLDAGAAERRAERITLRLDAIADNYRAVLPMIREAIEKRDDMALGYRSPGDYVSDRFGQSLAGLGMEVRRAVVGELTQAGLSTRAIAPVVGVSDRTVASDQKAGAKDFAPESDADLMDADLVDDEPVDDEPELTDTPGKVTKLTGPNSVSSPGRDDPAPAPEPVAPRPVTGIDGKTYQRPTPKAPPRKPLTDAFRDRLYDLGKQAESLHRLIEDDRWTQNAEKLAAVKNRNELLRINDLLEQVINSLPA